MIERERLASGDVFLFALAGTADVDGQRRLDRRQKLGGERGADALGDDGEIGARFQAVQSILQVSNNMIEADSPEASCRFIFAAGIGDDYDWMIAVQHRAGPGCELAAESDIDASRK